jgi:hypothetical protein
MQEKPRETPRKHEELQKKRQELHGERRKLHDRLSEVCEDFALQHQTRQYKQKALVRELQYLLDFYQDDENWEGVE